MAVIKVDPLCVSMKINYTVETVEVEAVFLSFYCMCVSAHHSASMRIKFIHIASRWHNILMAVTTVQGVFVFFLAAVAINPHSVSLILTYSLIMHHVDNNLRIHFIFFATTNVNMN